MEYKGYKGSVEYSKEDNSLLGKVQGMSNDQIRVAALWLRRALQSMILLTMPSRTS